MTRRTVIIRAVDDRALRLQVPGGCAGCSAAGCSSRHLNEPANAGELQLPLAYFGTTLPAGLKPGEQVDVAIEPRHYVAMISAVFLLPILLMLLSCVTCGALLSQSSGSMIVAAIVGLAVGSRLAKLLINRTVAGEDRALLNIVTAFPEAR